jgi:hypothetical protein
MGNRTTCAQLLQFCQIIIVRPSTKVDAEADMGEPLLNLHKPGGRILRFGLGEATAVCSPIWRMWVQGNEVYIAMRSAIGISKISLHSSGKWVFTAGTSRVPIKGPRRLNDNWSVGPRIVFPGLSPVTRLRAYEHEVNRKCFLFDNPATHYWRDFAVLFSKPATDPNDLVKLLPAGAEAMGPLPLRGGGASWLGTFVVEMAPSEIEYVESERAKFLVTVAGGLDSMRAAWANLVHDVESGETMIVNLELGRENIVQQC